MQLLCKLGIHKWGGCICQRCGAARNREHDWANCMCRRCSVEREHQWDGCICTRCGKRRDLQHQWEACICTRCGAKRDEEHQWDGCICTRCGKRRDLQHQWEACICTRCGAKRDEEHQWDGCTCTKCGRRRDVQHQWKECVCSVCGEIKHTWNGCVCSGCGKIRDNSHVWKGGICSRCGTKSPKVDFRDTFEQRMSSDEMKVCSEQEIVKCIKLDKIQDEVGFDILVGGRLEEVADFIYESIAKVAKKEWLTYLDISQIKSNCGKYVNIALKGKTKEIYVPYFECTISVKSTSYGAHQKLFTLGAFNCSGRFPYVAACRITDIPNEGIQRKLEKYSLISVKDAIDR